jgi:hypothetical protein
VKAKRPTKAERSFEELQVQLLRHAIYTDREQRGSPLDPPFTEEEMGNGVASVAAMLVQAAPFEKRAQLLCAIAGFIARRV